MSPGAGCPSIMAPGTTSTPTAGCAARVRLVPRLGLLVLGADRRRLVPHRLLHQLLRLPPRRRHRLPLGRLRLGGRQLGALRPLELRQHQLLPGRLPRRLSPGLLGRPPRARALRGAGRSPAGAGLERGVITTDTKPLRPNTWRDNGAVLHALNVRPSGPQGGHNLGSGREVPDVTQS